MQIYGWSIATDKHREAMMHHTVQRMLSSDTSAPIPEAWLALLRVATGVIVAWLHGWHKVVEGWQYAQSGAHWPLLHDTIALGFPVPVLFRALAAAGQFAGGLMLVVGAFTRVAALLVASTLVTALVFNLQTGGPDAQLAGLYRSSQAPSYLSAVGAGSGWRSASRQARTSL